MNKYDKFIKKSLNQMFTVVGFECFDEKFTKQEDWYTKATWSKIQENKFKQWFIKEAKKDLKFNKVTAEKEFAWFNLMWGWKSSDDVKVQSTE